MENIDVSAYSSLDRNGDGTITEEDFVQQTRSYAMPGIDQTTIREAFRQVDINGNGRVSINEVMTILRILMRLLGGSGGGIYPGGGGGGIYPGGRGGGIYPGGGGIYPGGGGIYPGGRGGGIYPGGGGIYPGGGGIYPGGGGVYPGGGGVYPGGGGVYPGGGGVYPGGGGVYPRPGGHNRGYSAGNNEGLEDDDGWSP